MNTAVCRCGLFAVGICTRCKEPVCGRHIASHAIVEDVVCDRCYREYKDEQRQGVDQARAEQEQKIRAYQHRPHLPFDALIKWIKKAETPDLDGYQFGAYTGRQVLTLAQALGSRRSQFLKSKTLGMKRFVEGYRITESHWSGPDPDRAWGGGSRDTWVDLAGNRWQVSTGSRGLRVVQTGGPDAVGEVGEVHGICWEKGFRLNSGI